VSTNLAAKCPPTVRPGVHQLCGQVSTSDAPVGRTGVMQTSRDVIPRKASRMVEEALADTRVITVNGARQAGKSTLARLAAAVRPGSVVRLLDDSATLRSATDDPAGFVEHDGLLVIDEVQLAPELFRSIKVAVDTDPRPGQLECIRFRGVGI
jgi:predicted AAA+ superfamily ATPase